ncbi:hypothetical protein D3C80_1587390 [compost metagenome]
MTPAGTAILAPLVSAVLKFASTTPVLLVLHKYLRLLKFTPTLSVTVTLVLLVFAHVLFPFIENATFGAVLSMTCMVLVAVPLFPLTSVASYVIV